MESGLATIELTRHENGDVTSGKRPCAVLIGACAHGLGIARSLDRAGITVVVLESNPNLPGVKTKHAEIRIVEDINGQGLVRGLIELAKIHRFSEKPVLFLTNDRMVNVVAQNINAITSYYNVSWSQSHEIICNLLDKRFIEERCKSAGLCYPSTAYVTDVAEIEKQIAEFSFPVIAKPTRPLSEFKTLVANSPDELLSYRKILKRNLPVLIQEYIQGDDTYIRFGALYLDKGCAVARFEGRKLRSFPMGHTTIAIAEPNDHVNEMAIRFFSGSGISGPVSLEFKEGTGGTLWVIEPTVGRTDFWVGLCISNGVNLPLLEYQSTIGERLPSPVGTNSHVWINGERDPAVLFWLMKISAKQLLTKRLCGVYLDQKDPLPFLISATRFIRKLPPRAIGRLNKCICGLKNSLGNNTAGCQHLADDLLAILEQLEELPGDLREKALTTFQSIGSEMVYEMRSWPRESVLMLSKNLRYKARSFEDTNRAYCLANSLAGLMLESSLHQHRIAGFVSDVLRSMSRSDFDSVAACDLRRIYDEKRIRHQLDLVK